MDRSFSGALEERQVASCHKASCAGTALARTWRVLVPAKIRRGAALEDAAGEDRALDLARALPDAVDAQLSVEPRRRVLDHVAAKRRARTRDLHAAGQPDAEQPETSRLRRCTTLRASRSSTARRRRRTSLADVHLEDDGLRASHRSSSRMTHEASSTRAASRSSRPRYRIESSPSAAAARRHPAPSGRPSVEPSRPRDPPRAAGRFARSRLGSAPARAVEAPRRRAARPDLVPERRRLLELGIDRAHERSLGPLGPGFSVASSASSPAIPGPPRRRTPRAGAPVAS